MRCAALLAVVCALSLAARVRADFVQPHAGVVLNTVVDSRLAGATTDTQHDDQTGSLSDPSVQASAKASLARPDGTACDAVGNAAGQLFSDTSTFRFTGSTEVALPSDCPFDGEVDSVSRLTFPFHVADGAQATISYDLAINAMVLHNEKVTLLLHRDRNQLFKKVFESNATGQLEKIGSGDFQLTVIAGATSTNRGVAGETGSAAFDVSLRSAAATAIPLPPALIPGLLTLVFSALMLRRAVC